MVNGWVWIVDGGGGLVDGLIGWLVDGGRSVFLCLLSFPTPTSWRTYTHTPSPLPQVFFPVNIDNTHWCLAIVHMQEKRIQYLDSMAGAGHMYLEGLKRWESASTVYGDITSSSPPASSHSHTPSSFTTHSYLADEHQDKKKAPLDMDDWELVPSSPRVTPQQGNGSDCGCFASAFAYLISEGIPFTHVCPCAFFSQKQNVLSMSCTYSQRRIPSSHLCMFGNRSPRRTWSASASA